MSIADKQSFRDAMAHVGAAVNIITTDGPAGRAGFTASAVGISGALIFGYLGALVFKPKMKD